MALYIQCMEAIGTHTTYLAQVGTPAPCPYPSTASLDQEQELDKDEDKEDNDNKWEVC